MEDRIEAVLRWFQYDHLPKSKQSIPRDCEALARRMIEKGEGDELYEGLRDLLRAKDCFVRAAIHKR